MKIDQQRRCKSVKKSVATYEKTTSHILYFFYMTTSLFITHNIIKLFVMSPKENLHHHSNITHWTKSLVKIVPMNSNHTEKLIPNIPLMKKNARTFISQKINKSFWIFECIKFVHFLDQCDISCAIKMELLIVVLPTMWHCFVCHPHFWTTENKHDNHIWKF